MKDKLLSTNSAIKALFEFAQEVDEHIYTKVISHEELKAMIDSFDIEYKSLNERVMKVGAQNASKGLRYDLAEIEVKLMVSRNIYNTTHKAGHHIT